MREDRIVNRRVVDREARALRRKEIREFRRQKIQEAQEAGRPFKPPAPRPRKRRPIPEPVTEPVVAPKPVPKPNPRPRHATKPAPPVVDSNDYPVEFLPLKNLDYRWAAPIFDKGKQDRLLRRFAGQENILIGEQNANKKNAVETRMNAVYKSFMAQGMINPLAVKQHDYTSEFDSMTGNHYVVVGNQRLCSLRAWSKQLTNKEFKNMVLGKWMTSAEIETEIETYPNNEDTRIPCRVCKDKDAWSDNTEPVRAVPYDQVENYPHNRKR